MDPDRALASLAHQLQANALLGESEDDADEVFPDNEGVTFAGKGLKLDTAVDAKVVVTAIEKASKVHWLCLEGNTLGVGAAEAVGDALSSRPELQAALWKDMFTGRLRDEIPSALQFLGAGPVSAGAHLTHLDLSDNAFGPVGVESLRHLLASPVCRSLRKLCLNNNGLGTAGGKLLAETLLEALEKSEADGGEGLKLRVFICGRNRLENGGAEALSRFFSRVRSLREVSMPQNGIYPEGVTALAKALAVNRELRRLNLEDNTLAEAGAEAIATILLPKLQQLQSLQLGDCLVRSTGARNLAAALQGAHPHLRELHLGFNEIGAAAGEFVIKAMDGKLSLRKLVLDGNQFGEEGCMKILYMAAHQGLGSVLGSLDEDEGADDDDDGEEEDDGDEDEDEGEEDDGEGDEGEGEGRDYVGVETWGKNEDLESGKNKNESIIIASPTKLEDLAPVEGNGEGFLCHPNAERLLGLGDACGDQLLDAIKERCLKGSNIAEESVSAMVVLSPLVTHWEQRVQMYAFRCFDALLAYLLSPPDLELGDDHSEVTPHDASIVINSILIHLGLLKSEDKSFKVLPQVPKGLLLALEYTVTQSYFPASARLMLQTFLARPCPELELYGSAKHRLMQALFRY